MRFGWTQDIGKASLSVKRIGGDLCGSILPHAFPFSLRLLRSLKREKFRYRLTFFLRWDTIRPNDLEEETPMKLEFIEVGQIVNTHGVRGELKLNPWDVEPEVLRRCKTFYIDGQALRPASARIHKNCLLFTLPGVGDLDSALGYKGKVVSIRRSDVRLPDGEYFTAELLGLSVLDAETKEELGKIADVIPYPGHDVYVVQGKKEFMVPAVPAFIGEIDMDKGTMEIHVWEGLI